jgi:hypothetical protein
MHSLSWRLNEHRARLQCDRLEAAVDLLRPAEGLVEVCSATGSLAGAHLLGIAIPWFPADEPPLCIEHYVRGADLVAAYGRPTNGPARVDALWRLLPPKRSEACMAAVELVVSVCTHLRESRPELAVQSELSPSEVLRLLDAESLGYQRLVPPPDPPMDLQPQDGPACLLFRPSGINLSYAEMVHPADFRHGQLWGKTGDSGMMRVRHQLFSERLEKGVILRWRVRGVFLSRQQDTHVAAACYAAFAAAEPPLST